MDPLDRRRRRSLRGSSSLLLRVDQPGGKIFSIRISLQVLQITAGEANGRGVGCQMMGLGAHHIGYMHAIWFPGTRSKIHGQLSVT